MTATKATISSGAGLRRRCSVAALLSVTTALTVAGCGQNLPEPGRLPPQGEAIKATKERFYQDGGTVPINRVRVKASSMQAKSVRQGITPALRARQIKVQFPGTDGTVGDLVQALSAAGVQVAFSWGDRGGAATPTAPGAAPRPAGAVGAAGGGASTSGDEVLRKRLPFPQYDGTLGGLLDTLKTGLGLVFWQEGNTIFLSDKNRFAIALPQNEDILKNISESLKALGATDVVSSLDAGKIVYSANPAIQDDIISPFLKRTVKNLATIDLQVAVVSLAMNDKSGQGFDWSKFSAIIDQRSAAVTQANAVGAPSTATGSNAGTTTGSGLGTTGTGVSNSLGQSTPQTILPTTILNQKGGVFDMTKDGIVLGTTGIGKAFGVSTVGSISSAISFLSTFGNTNVTQNVELRTLSGRQVKIRSGDEIPYVKGIGVGNLGSASTANSNVSGTGSSSNSQLGTAQTDTVKTGLTVEMVPRFDSDSELVTTELKMELKSVVEFIQLDAGNQLGKLTQPRTQDQELSNIVRLRAGQTVVIGGIQYDQEQFDGNEPTFMRDRMRQTSQAAGLRSQTINRNALFIILRPVVTTYEPVE